MPSSAGDGSSFSSTSRSSTEGSPSRSAAKFRHMFAQSSRREEWLDWGAGRASLIAVNPKFAAVALEGQAGGPVLIGRVSDVGKHPEMRKLDENRTPVTELRWSEFNDNVLASGNAGGVVLVWHVEDSLKTSVVRQLRRCSRRIECVLWHSTVDNLLFVASADPLIALWDVSSDVLVHETSSVHANYLSLSPSSSLFATVSKTAQRLSLFDSRSGVSLKSSRLVHDGAMSPRCVFLDEDKVVTTGSSPSRRRQLAVYSLSSFSSPIAVIDVDGGSGVLLPFADLDLSLLYVTGKGDLTLRVFLLTPSSPFLVYQTECQQSQSHTAVALQPKRVVRVKDCELARFFRLDPQQLLLQPLSLVVPRRSHVFQADLYPPTRSATPALRVEEWLAGLERAPVPLQLAPGQPSHATSKPVLLSQSQLITADANNERKFRFLSQVTKPDYREISAREDREEMVREASVKEELGAKKNSLSSMDCDEEEDPTRADDVEGEVEGDEVEGEDVSCVEEVEKRTAEVEAPPTATVHTCEQLDLVPWTANELPEERQAPAVAEGDRGEACWGERRMLEEALSVLERELRRSEARRERLERLLALQQQDIDSLRYEISWKDSRIDWLQTELARVQPPSAGTVEEESVDED